MAPSLFALLILAQISADAPNDAKNGPSTAPQIKELPPYAFVAEVGAYSGIAAGVHMAPLKILGLELTLGYQPVFVLYESNSDLKLHFKNSWQANADFLVMPYETGTGTRMGFTLGYKYNSFLKHGLGLGIAFALPAWEHVGIHILGGLAIFLDGSDRVEASINDPAADVSFLNGGTVQLGVSVGLLLY